VFLPGRRRKQNHHCNDVSAECQFDFEKAAIEQLGGYILAVCFDKDNLGINWREQTLRWLVVK